MIEQTLPGPGEPEEAIVRHYLAALNDGQVLEALSVFSMDASLRDETGHERHGIREIAAAFARRERPVKVEIEDLRREGDKLAVRVRMSSPADRRPKFYRSVFRVGGDRIRALEISPLPASKSSKGRPAQSERS